MRIKQAVILAGGLGTRLRPLTLKTPKPMIKIYRKPFLEHLLILLKKNKIKKVVILVGYLNKKIENYFGNGEKIGIEVQYSFSPIEADTGTRLRNAKNLLDNNFILLYGDNYWPLNLKELTKFYLEKNKKGLITVYSNHDNSTKNNIRINKGGLVEFYDKKRIAKNLNGVDIGFLILQKNIVDLIPSRNTSFEEFVIPYLAKRKELSGFLTHHKYYSLSNLERLPQVKDYFKEKKVIFLDRDGVINKKVKKAEYVTNWNDFIFLPKVKEALKLLKKRNYLIFIVTNQPGVARKIMTINQLEEIHSKLNRELESADIKINKIYSCTHGWDEGCFCRKPNSGMFFKAAAEFHFDLTRTYCVGDDRRDIIAGKSAGCKTFLVSKRNSLYDIVKKHL